MGAMSDAPPSVDCGVHGTQPIAFACTHIAHGLLDGTTAGFVIAPEGGEPLPLAWCDACEDMVVGLGGNWTEGASDRAAFKLLCAACYGEAKGLAIAANRFRNLRAVSGKE
jgi:hypothetical protein